MEYLTLRCYKCLNFQCYNNYEKIFKNNYKKYTIRNSDQLISLIKKKPLEYSIPRSHLLAKLK